jgi:hypothetical protein
MVASCCSPKRDLHMLYRVPEGDSANVAQSPPNVGPTRLVVLWLPVTSIANISAPFGPKAEVV